MSGIYSFTSGSSRKIWTTQKNKRAVKEENEIVSLCKQTKGHAKYECRRLKRLYAEHQAVNDLGDLAKYEVIKCSEEDKEIESLRQTREKNIQDITKICQDRRCIIYQRQNELNKKWVELEKMMREKGVEAIEIPHND